MPRFLDTRGNTKIAVAICGRCSRKFPYTDLVEDGNIPGLWVCPEDRDTLDPYRLPARMTEDITLDHPRPDVSISGEASTPLYGGNVLNPTFGVIPILAQPITALGPVRPWQPNTFYTRGDTITPQNVDDQNVDLPQVWLVCLEDGWSGDTPPVFPAQTGIPFRETISPVTVSAPGYFGGYIDGYLDSYI